MDPLSHLLSRFSFQARVFYNGNFCGSNGFLEDDQLGHLHLVRQGPVVMHHDDRATLQIETPSLVMYPRGLSHRLVVPQGAAAKLLCATVSFVDRSHNALAKALPDCLVIKLHDVPSLIQTLDLLFNEADATFSGKHVVLDRLCDVLLVQAFRHAFLTNQLDHRTLSGLSDPGLSNALVAIHNQPSHPWSVEKLANVSGMSRSKFAKQFHDVVGITPADYVTDRRITLAQSLLRRHKPVQIVATEVGYSSQPAFTKAFTAKVGMSPRAWLNHTADN